MRKKGMIYMAAGMLLAAVLTGGYVLSGYRGSVADTMESRKAECRLSDTPGAESRKAEYRLSEIPNAKIEFHSVQNVTAKQEAADSAEGFVLLADAVPDVIQEIRYYSTYNFVGERIDGYEEPCAMLTKEAAAALKEVSDEVSAQGYRLKVFDAYRPQMAVDHFIRWASDTGDTRMKDYFYPEVDKSNLFVQGYIGTKSGHSRGSTVDLTLFDMKTGKEVDMGGPFDYFGQRSHSGYTQGLTAEQIYNRAILREAMVRHGFRTLSTEWWHFTLNHEPYPNTYFTFPVSSSSVISE